MVLLFILYRKWQHFQFQTVVQNYPQSIAWWINVPERSYCVLPWHVLLDPPRSSSEPRPSKRCLQNKPPANRASFPRKRPTTATGKGVESSVWHRLDIVHTNLYRDMLYHYIKSGLLFLCIKLHRNQPNRKGSNPTVKAVYGMVHYDKNDPISFGPNHQVWYKI